MLSRNLRSLRNQWMPLIRPEFALYLTRESWTGVEVLSDLAHAAREDLTDLGQAAAALIPPLREGTLGAGQRALGIQRLGFEESFHRAGHYGVSVKVTSAGSPSMPPLPVQVPPPRKFNLRYRA